jgi:signal transduction histidine kinase
MSVRARSAAAATVVVGIALGLSSWGLLAVLRDSVERNAVATATTRAQDVAAELVADGRLTSGVNLAPAPGEQAYLQVVGDGVVRGASPGHSGVPPLVRTAPDPGDAVEVPGPGSDVPVGAPSVTVALGVGGVEGVDAVVIRQSYAGADETVLDTGQALTLGVPALVVLVGAVTYGLTGWSLAPVEHIRRRAALISASEMDARIDVPATGDEIARLAVTLNEMLDRLHIAHQAQERFVADASHELRSPLAAVRAELDVAARGGRDADWRRAAQVVGLATGRMQALVEDLLVLARTAEPEPALHAQDVDLDDVAETVGFAVRRGTELRVDVRTVPVRVRGHAGDLERLVQNLMDNAVRHAREEVRLTLVVDGGAAVLAVDDDGPGIPEAARAEVFERFVRLDPGRSRGSGGAGLGLAIVRGIVRAHGGTITVADSELGGARFVVRVPEAPGAPGAPDGQGASGAIR